MLDAQKLEREWMKGFEFGAEKSRVAAEISFHFIKEDTLETGYSRGYFLTVDGLRFRGGKFQALFCGFLEDKFAGYTLASMDAGESFPAVYKSLMSDYGDPREDKKVGDPVLKDEAWMTRYRLPAPADGAEVLSVAIWDIMEPYRITLWTQIGNDGKAITLFRFGLVDPYGHFGIKKPEKLRAAEGVEEQPSTLKQEQVAEVKWDSTRTEYNDDGKIAQIHHYKDGVEYYEFYHDNGKLKTKGQMQNGRRFGNWEFFYENGTRRAKELYEADTVRSWFYDEAAGRIEANGLRVNNKREGVWTWFHPSGQKKIEENYVGGAKNGIRTTWHDNGQKASEDAYVDGKLNGPSTEWDYNGKIHVRTYFLDGKQHGSRNEFENGRLLSSAGWQNGLQEGVCEFYNIYSGVVTQRTYWKDGKQIEAPSADLGKTWAAAKKKGGAYFIGKWVGDGDHPQYGKVYVEINISRPDKKGVCNWTYEVVVPSAKGMGGVRNGKLLLSQVFFSNADGIGNVELTPITHELKISYIPNEGWLHAALPIGPNFAMVKLKKY